MLVLSRKSGERLCIAEEIEVTIISVRGGRVRLGFKAPESVSIHRAEIRQRIDRERAATSPPTTPPPLCLEGANECT